MAILDEIKNNDIDILTLKDVPEDLFEDVHDLVDALAGNSSIHTVEFTHDFLSCAYGKDRCLLVEAISKLPQLQSVTISHTLLRVTALTALVANAKNLKVLNLREVVLQGVNREIDALESALYQHASIKDFSMMDCQSPCEDVDLDRVLRAGTASRSSDRNNPASIDVSGDPTIGGAIAA